MGIHISLATSADDAGIRALLRREPVPGRIAISFEREPDFSIGCDATGENATILVARDADSGATVGVACRSEREVYVNSMPMKLGYLGQLRIDRRYRGRWLVSRGYSLLKRLHDRDPLPGYLAAVTEDNREAAGVLAEKSRRVFPAFRRMADYCTLALPVRDSVCVTQAFGLARRRPAGTEGECPGDLGHGTAKGCATPTSGIANATPGEIPEIACFLRTEGPRRQFFPVWSEARLNALIRGLGLRIDDVQIARRNGSIAGLMGLWDQSAYKQSVVHSYEGWMKLALPLYNAGAHWLQRPPLPKAGEKIRNGYAAFVCIAHDDAAVFSELLTATLRRAAACGLDYLFLGLDTRDPLLAAARKRPHILYRSRLYLAEWPEGGHLHARLDRRPSYVEIATL
jgi:hypothetical protein